MPPRRCPMCKAIYWANPHTGDFVHNCDIPVVEISLRKEDILIIGNFEDFTGSGIRTKQEVTFAGITNTLSVEAQAQGQDFDSLTIRGNREATHRSRSRLQYIEDPMNPRD